MSVAPPLPSRDQPRAPPLPAASQRLDKWLWCARFARSRSLAAKLCAAGAVTLGGAPVRKPHQLVRPGDALTVIQGKLRRAVRVVALASRRGPAPEARLLYDEPEPPAPLVGEAWIPLLDDDPAEG